MNVPLIILDTESARVDGAPHLVELCALRCEGGQVVDRFHRLVRPRVAIDSESKRIHGLEDADVADAAQAPQVIAEFAAFAGGHWLVAHGARCDAALLGFEYARAASTPPAGRWLDTQALARRWVSGAPAFGLAPLATFLALGAQPRHRASEDALAVVALLSAMLVSRGGWHAFEPAKTPSAARPRPRIRAPLAPALAKRHRILAEACRARRPVTLHLDAADTPSSTTDRRCVDPVLIFPRAARGYLEARCRASGAWATHPLDTIQHVSLD